MATNRLLAVTKQIIRRAAEIGIDEAGTRVCGSAWPSVKKVLAPVFEELERRFPKLFLAGNAEAVAAAQAAEVAVSNETTLRAMLDKGLIQLESGQAEILKVLARYDETLQEIGVSIDAGFREAERSNKDASQAILTELKALKLEIVAVQRSTGTDSLYAASLSIDEIYRQANAYQHDAMKWISARDAPTASQRLAQGRDLLMAGLKREPTNAGLLVSLGYIEKSQAQVSQVLGNDDDAVSLLGEAAKYFVKALERDPSNVSALNGMANVYYFAHDYDRAIRLGVMIFNSSPDYGAAVLDLSLALEGKLKEVGPAPPLIKMLVVVYRYLEDLMPKQPQVFSASYLAYVQRRLQDLARLSPEEQKN